MDGGRFWLQGAGVDASARLYRGLGVAGGITGVRNGNIEGNGVGLTILSYLVGPRYN